ncbi:hypothetical protein Tco_0238132 [Tanacetum coccineum]
MMDADRLLAKRLQAREQEELTDEEKARFFVELLEKRKKHFAALRAQEKRNKPPTKAQKKSTMSTYLKHMAGYNQSQLKNKSFAEIQKLFDKAMTRVNMFVDMDTELVEGSEKRAEDSTKRAGTKLEQEVAKKQKIDDAKMDDDQEEARMKELMNIVPDEEEVAIDAIPLATKPPCIVDWKIIKKGKISQFQIIRADGSSKRSTRPEEGYKRVLWGGSNDNSTLSEIAIYAYLYAGREKCGVGIVGIKSSKAIWNYCSSNQSYLLQKKVNAAGTKLQLLKDYNCSRIKTVEKIKID